MLIASNTSFPSTGSDDFAKVVDIALKLKHPLANGSLYHVKGKEALGLLEFLVVVPW